MKFFNISKTVFDDIYPSITNEFFGTVVHRWKWATEKWFIYHWFIYHRCGGLGKISVLRSFAKRLKKFDCDFERTRENFWPLLPYFNESLPPATPIGTAGGNFLKFYSFLAIFSPFFHLDMKSTIGLGRRLAGPARPGPTDRQTDSLSAYPGGLTVRPAPTLVTDLVPLFFF